MDPVSHAGELPAFVVLSYVVIMNDYSKHISSSHAFLDLGLIFTPSRLEIRFVLRPKDSFVHSTDAVILGIEC